MQQQVIMLWCLRTSPAIDLRGNHGKCVGEGGQGGVAEADHIFR